MLSHYFLSSASTFKKQGLQLLKRELKWNVYKHRPNKVLWDTKKGWFCLEETKRLQERGDTGPRGSLIRLTESVGEEKLLLYPLTFSDWGLWIKVTKDRLTREKVYFICTRRGPHRKDMWAYIPFKQRSINCGEMIRQRKTGLIFLGTVNCGKVNMRETNGR